MNRIVLEKVSGDFIIFLSHAVLRLIFDTSKPFVRRFAGFLFLFLLAIGAVQFSNRLKTWLGARVPCVWKLMMQRVGSERMAWYFLLTSSSGCLRTRSRVGDGGLGSSICNRSVHFVCVILRHWYPRAFPVFRCRMVGGPRIWAQSIWTLKKGITLWDPACSCLLTIKLFSSSSGFRLSWITRVTFECLINLSRCVAQSTAMTIGC